MAVFLPLHQRLDNFLNSGYPPADILGLDRYHIYARIKFSVAVLLKGKLQLQLS
jgi:hypothetical protein